MINLSQNKLKLLAPNRNIRGYENKSGNDFVKALSEPKAQIKKKKLEEIRKHFGELRHKFSKTEMNGYRKTFYDIKNYRHIYVPDVKNFRHLSKSEIAKVRKNLIK